MEIVLASAEVAPFSGREEQGLMVEGLAKALHGEGHKVTVIMPRYGRIDPDRYSMARRLRTVSVEGGEGDVAARVFEGNLCEGVSLFMVDHEPSFGEEAEVGDHRRFSFFSRAALGLCKAYKIRPDILHCFDWSTALVPLFLRSHLIEGLEETRTVLTVQDIRSQGLFPGELLGETGIPEGLFTPGGVEYYGEINFLKGGLLFADGVTTVSEGHGQELLTKEHGQGLEGILEYRGARFRGILSGIDGEHWNPAWDRHLPQSYDRSSLRGKIECKEAFQREVGLPDYEPLPLIVSVAPLGDQYGHDLIAGVIEDLLSLQTQVALLGDGDESYRSLFAELARRNKHRMVFVPSFDEGLHHRAVAAGDMYLLPSVSEPSAGAHLPALAYGTVPVVRSVGAFMDTVVDYNAKLGQGWGFLFHSSRPSQLMSLLRRAVRVYKSRRTWLTLVRRCMGRDLSWSRAARSYLSFYQELLGPEQPLGVNRTTGESEPWMSL